jgi:hypothetical protein
MDSGQSGVRPRICRAIVWERYVARTKSTASTKVTFTPETQGTRAAGGTAQGTWAAGGTAQGITTDSSSTGQGTTTDSSRNKGPTSEGHAADSRKSAADIFGPKSPQGPDAFASKGEGAQHPESCAHTRASSEGKCAT